MAEDDPFGSLVKSCKTTSSQENVLRTCPFARQSELFSDDDESPSSEPVVGTAIVMVSPPETSQEDFLTPNEDSLPPPSSEEQRPPEPVAVDGGETVAVGVDFTDAEIVVDLGKDSENLGFSVAKSTEVIDGGGEVLERELEKFVVLQRENDVSFESQSKKLKLFSEKKIGGFESPRARAGDNESTIIETNRDEIASTEVIIDLEGEEEMGEKLDEDKVFVEMPQRETKEISKENDVQKNGNRGLVRKNIDDLDKFRYVSSSAVNRSEKVIGGGGRRELPTSIGGQGRNDGGEVGSGNLGAKNEILKGLLDALKMVAGEVDGGSKEDVDFLETAKQRCMTFPRPRWWPPEGYE